jgi:hypothetical protein
MSIAIAFVLHFDVVVSLQFAAGDVEVEVEIPFELEMTSWSACVSWRVIVIVRVIVFVMAIVNGTWNSPSQHHEHVNICRHFVYCYLNVVDDLFVSFHCCLNHEHDEHEHEHCC